MCNSNINLYLNNLFFYECTKTVGERKTLIGEIFTRINTS